MLIHHLALPDDWAEAQAAGDYRVSTRGVTLEQEGFIHCSKPEQVEPVREAFYADVHQLVLLTIDTDLLTSPWQLDPVEDQEFPHVYGPINLGAVVDVSLIGMG
jgi:glutathione S-transferase